MFEKLILPIITAFLGGLNIVQLVIMWKSRKSEVKKNEAGALDSIDSIYDKMSARVDKELIKYEKIIEKQDGKIQSQDEKIQSLHKDLREYITQCEICPNNKIKKTRSKGS